MTPDLNALNEFMFRVDEWEKAGTPLEALLDQLLPVVQRLLPEAAILCFYHVKGTILLPLAAVNRPLSENPDPLDAADHPSYQQALTTLEPVRLQSPDGWLVALRSTSTPWGLLEIAGLPAAQDPQRIQDVQQWLHLAAKYMALVVARNMPDIDSRTQMRQTQSTRQEAHLLYEMNRELLVAQDGMQVLRVLRTHLAPDAESLVLSEIAWDEETGQLSAVVARYLILADGEEKTSERNLLDSISPVMLQHLRDEWEIQGRDVDFIENLGDIMEERPIARLSYESGLRSMVVIPMYDRDYLVQQVSINFKEPRTFNPRTRRLYSAIRDQVTIVLQNRRLFSDIQSSAARMSNQVRVLQIINRLSADLATLDTEAALMQRTCETLYHALQVDHVGVTTLDPGGKTATVVYEYPDRGTVGVKIHEDDQVQTRLHSDRNPIIINDLMNDTNFSETNRAALTAIGIKALMLCPLYDTDLRYIGAIGLDVYELGRPFTPEMRDIAQTITSQVAVTLQNLRLLAAAQQQASRMGQIAQLGRNLQLSFDIPELLKSALEGLRQVLPTEAINICFYQPEKDRLQVVAWHEAGHNHIEPAYGPYISPTLSTAGQAWQQQAPFYLDNLQEGDGLFFANSRGIRSVMALLLYAQGKAIGVLEIGQQKPYAYSTVDQVVFQQSAGQVSVALANARAYARTQNLANSKARVNEITRVMQQQMSLEEMLDVTLRELGQSLGAKRARIRIDPTLADHKPDQAHRPDQHPANGHEGKPQNGA